MGNYKETLKQMKQELLDNITTKDIRSLWERFRFDAYENRSSLSIKEVFKIDEKASVDKVKRGGGHSLREFVDSYNHQNTLKHNSWNRNDVNDLIDAIPTETRKEVVYKYIDKIFTLLEEDIENVISLRKKYTNAEVRGFVLEGTRDEVFSFKMNQSGNIIFKMGNNTYIDMEWPKGVSEEKAEQALAARWGQSVFDQKPLGNTNPSGSMEERVNVLNVWNEVMVEEEMGDVVYYQNPEDIVIKDGKLQVYSFEKNKERRFVMTGDALQELYLFKEKEISIDEIERINGKLTKDLMEIKDKKNGNHNTK